MEFWGLKFGYLKVKFYQNKNNLEYIDGLYIENLQFY